MGIPGLESAFPYEVDEYNFIKERLERMLREPDEIKEELSQRIYGIDPDSPEAFKALYVESGRLIHALYRRKWAKEVLDKLEDEKVTKGPINEHGHYVNDDEIPWLFWFLQIQRRSLWKKIVDNPRQGIAFGHDGFFISEGIAAMTIFYDDFVDIGPSLRKIDLGKEDPLKNSL